MSRAKDLIKIMFFIYVMGKGTHQPQRGNYFIREAIEQFQNLFEIDELINKHFIEDFENNDVEEGGGGNDGIFSNLWNCVCNFDELLFPEEQMRGDTDLDIAVYMYLCCLSYQLRLENQPHYDTCGPTVALLCDLVQKEMPMLESDVNAVLEQLHYSFLIFDDDDDDYDGTSEDDHDIINPNEAPQRIYQLLNLKMLMHSLMLANELAKLETTADYVEGSNSGNIYDSAKPFEPMDEIEFEFIEHPFGGNGIVIVRMKRVTESANGTLDFECMPLENEDDDDLNEVAFHDGEDVAFENQLMWPFKMFFPEIRSQRQRYRRWA